jgi:rhodanese-related sulfurtransferase
MFLALTAICVAVLCLAILVWRRGKDQEDRDALEQHSLTAEELHSLSASNQKILVFDVRQPLDLLAYPEIIPGARRIPPRDLQANPSLIPKDKEVVVYCTCAGDKTSREVLHRALALHFSRIKFLKGGLEAWKAKGYPVEPYREVFHLYDPTLAADSG